MRIELTGRTRYRAQKLWFRKEPLVVLQVEKRHRGYDMTSVGGYVDSQPYDFTQWHDATFSDFGDLPNTTPRY